MLHKPLKIENKRAAELIVETTLLFGRESYEHESLQKLIKICENKAELAYAANMFGYLCALQDILRYGIHFVDLEYQKGANLYRLAKVVSKEAAIQYVLKEMENVEKYERQRDEVRDVV